MSSFRYIDGEGSVRHDLMPSPSDVEDWLAELELDTVVQSPAPSTKAKKKKKKKRKKKRKKEVDVTTFEVLTTEVRRQVGLP